MPKGTEALLVMKVLYRNAERIQRFGGRKVEVLKPMTGQAAAAQKKQLRAATRAGTVDDAENVFYAQSQGDVADAFNSLQPIVHDDINVHRVALAWRSWDVLRLTGEEHAHTLLRQSVRYCVQEENYWIRPKRQGKLPIRETLPKMLDQYKLVGRKPGTKQGDDQWLGELTGAVFSGTREQAAEAAAAALAEGYSPESVAEAISLAANQLVLHDPGRSRNVKRKGHSERLKGSVHGDSIGVHASDAANAWRNIARVSNHTNTMASLVTAAFYTAGQASRVGK